MAASCCPQSYLTPAIGPDSTYFQDLESIALLSSILVRLERGRDAAKTWTSLCNGLVAQHPWVKVRGIPRPLRHTVVSGNLAEVV